MGLNGLGGGSTIIGDLCAGDFTQSWGGSLLMIDNQNYRNPSSRVDGMPCPEDDSGDNVALQESTERTTAHELGHILTLGEGDGEDNDPQNGLFDSFCDSTEDLCNTPESSFMTQSNCCRLSTRMSTWQRNTVEAFASVYGEDPEEADSSGRALAVPSVRGDRFYDPSFDADESFVDLGNHFVCYLFARCDPCSWSHS